MQTGTGADVYLGGASGRSGTWYDYPLSRLLESASQDAYGIHRARAHSDGADLVLIASNWGYPPMGWTAAADPFWQRCPERTVFVNSDDNPSPWVGGLCASWRPDLGPVGVAAVGWCYFHPESAEVGLEEQPWRPVPRYLWSFRGSFRTHPVRRRLATLGDADALVQDTSAASQMNLMGGNAEDERRRFRADYVELLRDSTFVACPRGEGASSMRIFEAMRAGRAPVIVADSWTPPPFVDWDACSIRLAERALAALPDLLRERRGDGEAMGRRARLEWERVFGPNALFHHTVEAALALRERRQRSFRWRCGVRYWQIARPRVIREMIRYGLSRLRR